MERGNINIGNWTNGKGNINIGNWNNGKRKHKHRKLK